MIFVLVLIVINGGLSQPPVRMSDQDARVPGAPLRLAIVTHLGATGWQSIFLCCGLLARRLLAALVLPVPKPPPKKLLNQT